LPRSADSGSRGVTRSQSERRACDAHGNSRCRATAENSVKNPSFLNNVIGLDNQLNSGEFCRQ